MKQGANTSPFEQIGIISRSHGIHGELKVLFEIENPEAISELKMVYLRNVRGDFFPKRVQDIRIEEKKNKLSFFVQFEQITDRSAAEALKNHGVFLEKEAAKAFLDSDYESDLPIDYEVYDELNNHIGRVTEVFESPAQIVLQIATTSGNLLIPFVDEFVTNVDDEEMTIQCQHLDRFEDS